MGAIVVGVDGSASSLAALRWALEEARRHKSVLRVVTVRTFPFTVGEIAHQAALAAHEGLERDARMRQDAVLRAVDYDVAGITVERVIAAGPPARALLEAAQGADLLVVGPRGRGDSVGYSWARLASSASNTPRARSSSYIRESRATPTVNRASQGSGPPGLV